MQSLPFKSRIPASLILGCSGVTPRPSQMQAGIHALSWGLGSQVVHRPHCEKQDANLCSMSERKGESEKLKETQKEGKKCLLSYLVSVEQRVMDFDSQIPTQSFLTDVMPKCSLHKSKDREKFTETVNHSRKVWSWKAESWKEDRGNVLRRKLNLRLKWY